MGAPRSAAIEKSHRGREDKCQTPTLSELTLYPFCLRCIAMANGVRTLPLRYLNGFDGLGYLIKKPLHLQHISPNYVPYILSLRSSWSEAGTKSFHRSQ
jgi:hypothetical protein